MNRRIITTYNSYHVASKSRHHLILDMSIPDPASDSSRTPTPFPSTASPPSTPPTLSTSAKGTVNCEINFKPEYSMIYC